MKTLQEVIGDFGDSTIRFVFVIVDYAVDDRKFYGFRHARLSGDHSPDVEANFRELKRRFGRCAGFKIMSTLSGELPGFWADARLSDAKAAELVDAISTMDAVVYMAEEAYDIEDEWRGKAWRSGLRQEVEEAVGRKFPKWWDFVNWLDDTMVAADLSEFEYFEGTWGLHTGRLVDRLKESGYRPG